MCLIGICILLFFCLFIVIFLGGELIWLWTNRQPDRQSNRQTAVQSVRTSFIERVSISACHSASQSVSRPVYLTQIKKCVGVSQSQLGGRAWTGGSREKGKAKGKEREREVNVCNC